MTTEDRIKKLEAKLDLLHHRICCLSADMVWTDGPAYYLDRAAANAALQEQAEVYAEIRSLTVHTAVIPWYIIADRARESQQAASKERIAKALTQMNAQYGHTTKEVV